MALRTRTLGSRLRNLGGGAGGRSSATRRTPSWFHENLEHSLPFMLAGGLCLGIGFWIDATTAHTPGHPSIWLLLVAVGATVVGGGVALTFVSEETEPSAEVIENRFVMVDREEWERLHGPEVTEAPPVTPGSPAEYLEDAPPTPESPDAPPPWLESEPEPQPLPAAGSRGVTEEWGARVPARAAASATPTAQPPLSARSYDSAPVPPWAPVAGAPAQIGPPRGTPDPSVPAASLSQPASAVAGGPPAKPGTAAQARPELTGKPAAPSISPAEENLEELVSELNAIAGSQVAPTAPPPPSRTSLTSTIARSQNRCTSCARQLDEQRAVVCVSCETPLCSQCQEASTRKRGVALCTECARVFDHPEVWLGRPPEG